jgi:serpin B
MRTTRLTIAAFSLVGILLAPAPGQPTPVPDGNAKAAPPTVAYANNAFALDLYASLRQRQGNLFFSPHSIHVALGMTYAGARGPTARQMASVLHLTIPQDKLHAAFAALIKDLNTGGKIGDRELYKLVVANALWAQNGYPFHADFQNVVSANYRAALRQVDFINATEDARLEINRWVEKQTNDKIKNLLPTGVLTPLTRLVLTNAIYFKSSWANQFPKFATRDAPFHVTSDKTTQVKMMRQAERFGYFEADDLQAVELPYIVLLPRNADGLADLEKNLTGAKLADWVGGLKARRAQLALPRFTFSSQFSLSKTLQSLGMTDAFSPDAADLSGIATVEKLFIQAVIHKAFVDVNEEGTEAAAATAVAIGVGAMLEPDKPVVFTADHPFLFVIRHRDSGAILFIGRVVNPAG